MKKRQIRLSYAADKDLSDISTYITEELKNPEAAQTAVAKIIEEYERLSEFPELGANISSVLGVKTEFRRLVCGNYNVFYKFDNEYISVYRILYGRANYIQKLFY